MLADPVNELLFSAASLGEIARKQDLGRDDFHVDARVLRRGLLDNGCLEWAVGSEHAFAIDNLASIRKDSFDRMLVAHVMVEAITLPTSDAVVVRCEKSERGRAVSVPSDS